MDEAHKPTPRVVSPADDRMMTVKELTARWDMTDRTLRNMRKNKQGPMPTLIGGALRYRLSDVVAYEDSGQVRAETEASGKQNDSGKVVEQ